MSGTDGGKRTCLTKTQAHSNPLCFNMNQSLKEIFLRIHFAKASSVSAYMSGGGGEILSEFHEYIQPLVAVHGASIGGSSKSPRNCPPTHTHSLVSHCPSFLSLSCAVLTFLLPSYGFTILTLRAILYFSP